MTDCIVLTAPPLLLSMSDRPIRVEPDECVTVAGLASGAAEAAQPLARAIFDAIARS